MTTFDVTLPPYNVVADNNPNSAITNCLGIQAAIADAKAAGGGIIYLPSGTIYLHRNNPTFAHSSAPTLLHIDSSDIWLVGTRRTVLKCRDSFVYSILRCNVFPTVNGSVNIVKGGLCGIEFDGNFDTVADIGLVTHESGIMLVGAAGLKDYVIEDCVFRNSPDYGIGLQNGGFQNVTIKDCLFEDLANDAIDVKNNGSTIEGGVIENITVRRFGRATDPTAPFAAIDLMGLGWRLSNISVTDFGDVGSVNAAIRFKQGELADSRGIGANSCSLTNFYISAAANATNPVTGGVKISARQVSVSNGSINNCPGKGMEIEQMEAAITAVSVVGCGSGFVCEPSNYGSNGDRAMFSSCIARSCTNEGWYVQTDSVSIVGCASRSNGIGLRLYSNATNFSWIGGELASNSNPVVNASSHINNVIANVPGYSFAFKAVSTSADNYIQTNGSSSGAPVTLSAQGISGEIDLILRGKTSGLPSGAGVDAYRLRFINGAGLALTNPGEATIDFPSNTTARLKFHGSDGKVRAATFNLSLV